MEIWKEIKEFNGKYLVSDLGNVKNRENKIIKPYKVNKGYLLVRLSIDCKKISRSIHSLVWKTFTDLPYEPKKLQIDHINNNNII